jgi:hypothetical protein
MHPNLVVARKGLQGIWEDRPAGAGVVDLSEVGWAAAK